MDGSDYLLFQQLGTSLLLGLLVGFQRQHADSSIGGLRTFPLITLLGSFSALLDTSASAGGWILASGFLAVAALVAITNLNRMRSAAPDYGMTTEAALLLMFAVGAYVVIGSLIVAVAVAAGIAVLLQFKPELHGIVDRLGDEDVRAIMTFALITCVVLPVLPDTTYDVTVPLNVINPFQTWLMVVLMVGISLGGYLTYKFFGRNAGIVLGGILGGSISSTATTVSYAKRTASQANGVRLAATVIVIASTVVYGRVLLEIAIVAPEYLGRFAAPIGIMIVATAVAAAIAWLRARKESEEMPEQRNPTELKSAIVFGILYAIVLMALASARTYFAGHGIYAIAAISGMTDMDAITLSTARLVQVGSVAGGISIDDGWRLIIVASMSNLVFKWLIVAVAAHRQLMWRVAALFMIPMLAGIGLLLFWPAVL